MTRRRALDILLHVWGHGQSVGPKTAQEIDDAQPGDATLLQKVCNLAGLPDLPAQVKPYDTDTIRVVASRALALLDVSMARTRTCTCMCHQPGVTMLHVVACC